MKTIDLTMERTEEKPITLQVIDLQEGENVADATATHTPPTGGDVLDIFPTVETPYVSMVFGPFEVVGSHFVLVKAVGDADRPSMPVVLYVVKVK